MSLTKQCHVYSIGTEAFYNNQEQYIHKRLVKLYTARKKSIALANKKQKYNKNFSLTWRIKSYNRIIKKEKQKLINLLDQNLNNTESRILNIDVLIDKNIISLFESSLTRILKIKQNELSTKLIIVNVFFFQIFNNIVKNGFLYNNEKYIFLTASAGQIRTKKAVFIQEKEYKQIEQTIMCGLTVEEINERGGINPNKFLSYLALSNSATDVWENFDIDKSIVVNDFETLVEGIVDYIDDTTYEIVRKKMKIPICHTDGCGIMLDQPTRMVRLPFIKGLLVYFPFDKFIKEKCPDGQCIVTDIYGENHDILNEGIKYIFTKSQFKLNKFYSSWDCYKARFKTFGCEASYCNIEETDVPISRINYQMLQTLSDMTDIEIQNLTKITVKEIENIGFDYQTTLKLLGATKQNKNPNAFQKAIMLYPELFRDGYSKDILKQTKKSLIKQAKAGRLKVNGKYYFLSPDLYAFCEWLFLKNENPKGLLADKEIYCSEYQDKDELACLRSPHLYREWAIRTNKKNQEISKWFGNTKCIYTSCYDLISKILQFDNDGDKSLVIKDKLLINIAKRNMQNIVPLYYNMKKATGGLLNSDSLYQGMIQAYTGGNIGPISNNISRIWNDDHITQKHLNIVKWLCLINNEVIDFSKTLWRSTPPDNVKKLIQSYTNTKLPYFFQYAKDKTINQVNSINNSTMNRISQAIPNSKIKFNKKLDKFDYRMLMNLDYNFDLSSNNSIMRSYDYWNNHQYLFNQEKNNNYAQYEDLYIYQKIREQILHENPQDLNYILNTLIMHLYTLRPNSTKNLLWGSFGEYIVNNLEKNTKDLGKNCIICGHRYQPKHKRQLCCCTECSKILKSKLTHNIDW